jgi:hypothetical protein
MQLVQPLNGQAGQQVVLDMQVVAVGKPGQKWRRADAPAVSEGVCAIGIATVVFGKLDQRVHRGCDQEEWQKPAVQQEFAAKEVGYGTDS